MDESHRNSGGREEFLTARQLSEILQVSESTVRRLSRNGRIPAIHITRRITRYHLQSVREALDGGSSHKRGGLRRSATVEDQENQQLSFTDLF